MHVEVDRRSRAVIAKDHLQHPRVPADTGSVRSNGTGVHAVERGHADLRIEVVAVDDRLAGELLQAVERVLAFAARHADPVVALGKAVHVAQRECAFQVGQQLFLAARAAGGG